jgi:hypothetical protein
MKWHRGKPAVPGPATLAGTMVIAAYAWWATGLRSFTAGAYVAVGLPVAALVLVVLVVRPDGSARTESRAGVEGSEIRLRTTFPWLLLLALAVGLEAGGLALGGRSTVVPTLSTVADHALAWHAVRFVLFCGWLAVGWAPVLRMTFRGNAGAD